MRDRGSRRKRLWGAGVDWLILLCALCVAGLMSLPFRRAPVHGTEELAPVHPQSGYGILWQEGRSVVDLNTADFFTLRGLPGVGDVLAQRIIDYREKVAPFSQVEDLLLVEGVGEGKLSRLRDLCGVEGG